MPRLARAFGGAVIALLAATSFADASTPAYVERAGFQTYLQRPSTLPFSVDGDLAGEHLRWRDWGAPESTARGTIYERAGYPSYGSATAPGTIVLSRLQRCNGARYYTRYTIHASGRLPFTPRSGVLYTPCSRG